MKLRVTKPKDPSLAPVDESTLVEGRTALKRPRAVDVEKAVSKRKNDSTILGGKSAEGSRGTEGSPALKKSKLDRCKIQK